MSPTNNNYEHNSFEAEQLQIISNTPKTPSSRKSEKQQNEEVILQQHDDDDYTTKTNTAHTTGTHNVTNITPSSRRRKAINSNKKQQEQQQSLASPSGSSLTPALKLLKAKMSMDVLSPVFDDTTDNNNHDNYCISAPSISDDNNNIIIMSSEAHNFVLTPHNNNSNNDYYDNPSLKEEYSIESTRKTLVYHPLRESITTIATTTSPDSSLADNNKNEDYSIQPVTKPPTNKAATTSNDNNSIDKAYVDLKSAKKKLGDRSSALVEILRKESQRRKIELARKQSDLAAKERKKQILLLSLKNRNNRVDADDDESMNVGIEERANKKSITQKGQGNTNDHYKPFKARPAPATMGKMGNGGQHGIPKVAKKLATIPKSPKLGLHRTTKRVEHIKTNAKIIGTQTRSIITTGVEGSKIDRPTKNNGDYHMPIAMKNSNAQLRKIRKDAEIYMLPQWNL